MRGLCASLLIPQDLLGAGLRAEDGVQGTVCGPHRSAPLTCFSTVLRAGLRGRAAASWLTPAVQTPSHSLMAAELSAPRSKSIPREKEPHAVKNGGDHGLLSRLAEVTAASLGSSQSAPCWRAEM